MEEFMSITISPLIGNGNDKNTPFLNAPPLVKSDVEVAFRCFAKNEGYDSFRFALVVYFGTPIAICGIISNAIIINVFASQKNFKSPTLYLFILAIFDFLICAIYIPFFTVDALAIYLSNPIMHRLWHLYVMTLYGTSRVVQFGSTYMVLCATLERFIIVAKLQSLAFISTIRGRFFMVSITLFVVLMLRLLSFFDYKIEYNSHCPIFQDFSFEPFLMSRVDYQMYNFYVICVLHIFLPFLVLLILNLLIIALTKKKIHHKYTPSYVRTFSEMRQISMLLKKESLFPQCKHRNELRYATRTMVMITFTYLFCNVFNVIITVMENVFKENRLMFNEDGSSTNFYTYTADLISITVTINSFARIFVYFFCDLEFRNQLTSYVNKCIFSADKKLKNITINKKNNEQLNTDLILITNKTTPIVNSKTIKKELQITQNQNDRQKQSRNNLASLQQRFSLPNTVDLKTLNNKKKYGKNNQFIVTNNLINIGDNLKKRRTTFDGLKYCAKDQALPKTDLIMIRNQSCESSSANLCALNTPHSSISTLYV